MPTPHRLFANNRGAFLLLAAALTTFSTLPAVSAAGLSWSSSGNATLGGSGTWDTTNPLWWDGGSAVVWPASGTDNDAVFAGTAGDVAVDPAGVAANDITFTTTGYILSGSGNITLNGTTPTITVGSGLTATFGNNTATVLAGSDGLTKAGAGTLTLSGNAVNTLTGGIAVRGGTLALALNNLDTPTDLLNSGNALALYNGGTISVTGKNGPYNSAQTVNGTTVYTGNSAVLVNNASGTSTTFTLGNVTQAEIGGVVSISASNPAIQSPNTTSQIIIASNPINSYIGPWATIADSKSSTARWAYVNASSQVLAITGTAAGANMTSVTSNSTVYTITGTNTLASDKTAFAIQDNDNFSASVTLGNFTITTNGLSQIRAGGTYTRSFLQGTNGTGTIIVGSSNELVAMGLNNLTIAVPIANGTGGNSNVTYAGGGTFLLSANNTFSGQMTVNSGTVRIGPGGSINSSSGIKVNGGNFVQTNTSTAVTPTVTLQGGTVDGTGTINTVTVTDLAANVVANGNGTTSALTINDLTFGGDATVNIRTAGSAGLTVTNTLTTTPANGLVTLNVPTAPVWITGNSYNLIGYGSWSGAITDFAKGTIPGLGARQTATLGTTGASNGFITLDIAGEGIVWTGAASGNWTTAAVGSPFNWKTSVGGVDTEFLTADDVIFNDTAATFALEISTASVSPNTTTFNNSSANYTVSSAGGFGIASGLLTKSGAGTLTLTTNNTYSGATTINGGTLQVIGGSAIANTGLVTLADAAGATLHVVASETIGALSGGGATGGAVTIDPGQTLTLASGTRTYNGTVAGAGTLANAGATQTLAGNLTHTGGVNANSGVLTLASSGNTYTGNTTIASGAGLVVSANNALGATGAGNETVIIGTGSGLIGGALGLSGNVNYSAAEKVTGSGVGNTAANGVFASVQRGFIQSVSGNNTFAGAVEINATGLSRFGTQTGAQLTLSGPVTMAAGVSGVQPLFRAGDNNGDFVTLTNTGNNWDLETLIYSGGSTGNAGLRLGANNALPTGISVLGATSSLPATSLDLAGFNQTMNGLSGASGAGQGQLKITNTAAATMSVLTFNNTLDRANVNTSILDGAGQIAVVKQGAFFQSLGANNTYTGTTTIQGGTLEFAKTASLYNGNNSSWTAANISVDAGAALSLAVGGAGEFTGADAGTVISNLTTGITSNGLKAGSAIGLNVTAPTTVSTVIADSTGTGAGALALVKSGASTLTLHQANTYSGGTRLNDGYLTVSHSSALGTGNLTLGAGAERLNVASGVNMANPIIIDGANSGVGNGAIQNLNLAPDENATVSGNITINAAPTTGGFFASQGTNSTLTIAGAVLSANTTVSVRSGTVVFSGAGSSYAALQVTGTARLGAANALATNAVVDLGSAGSAGTIDLAGFDQSLAGVTKLTGSPGTVGNSSNATDSTLTLTGSSTYAGTIQDSLSGGTRKVNLTVNGPGQTVTLTAANSFTGVTTITAGTLVVSSTGNISSSASTVNGGTLTVDGFAGDITVNSGGALTGNGTAGALVVNTGGSLAPGNSPGVLSLSLATLAGTTTLELAGPGGVPGTDYDRLAVTGAITYGGGLNIASFGGYDLTQSATYGLFTFGSQSGDFASVAVGATSLTLNTGVWTGADISGNSYAFSQIDGTLSVVAIPEAQTWALLGVGLVCMFFRMGARSRRI